VCGEWKHSRVKHEEGLTVQLKARVSKVDCSALIDTGASHSIIDANFVAKAGLRALRAKKILRATIPGNTTITLNRVVTVPVTIGNMHSTNTFYVMTGMLRGVDAIIGMDWMVRHDAWVGTREALLHVTTPSGKNLVLKGVSNADEGFAVGRSGHLRLIVTDHIYSETYPNTATSAYCHLLQMVAKQVPCKSQVRVFGM
jgi:hypothetical protein